jgi:hypothetical protein
MSTVSDPPGAKRSDTAAPFATLGSPSSGRSTTGPRIRIDSVPDSGAGPFVGEAAVRPSVDPAALQKPFASLIPTRPKASSAEREPSIAAPPPPPSQLFAETAQRAPRLGTATATAAAAAGAAAARTTTSRRPETTQAGKYGVCKEHGTALTREGACVLCVRAEAKRKSERGWRLMVIAVVAALLTGVAVAATLIPGSPLR